MNESAVYEIRLKDRFTSPLAGMESRMNGFERKVGSLGGTFGILGGSIVGAFAGGAVVGAVQSLISSIGNIADEIIRTTREFDNLKSSIEFASGKEAAKNIQFVDDIINRLGLDVEATYQGFKTFQGGLMGTSLEGEKGLRIFEAVSEAATVMKLSADQTKGTFLALGQMISKGNVQAEELRGQLGERLPGAFNIFARSMGVTTAQLNDMLKDGTVIAEETLPAFAEELKRTFSPGVIKASESFNSNMNRLNNFFFRAKIQLGNEILPALNEFVTIIPKLDFSPLLYTFQQLRQEMAGVLSLIDEITESFGFSLSVFEKFTLVLRYFSYLFRVAWTPIRVGIQVWTQLVTLIKNSYGIFEGLGNILVGSFTKDFVQVVKGIKQIGEAVVKIGEDASDKAGEFWEREKEGWKKIFAPLNGPAVADFSSGVNSPSRAGLLTGGGKPKGKDSTAGVEKISSGTRNINVTIHKLVENITFEKANGQSESQLMDMVKKALLTAVNDVNIVADK